MNLLTKGIFSSIASFVFLFSSVETIDVSNAENSPLLMESQIVSLENGVNDNTQPTIFKKIKSHTDEILNIVKNNSKQTLPEQIKFWADVSWFTLLNTVCWLLFLGWLLLLWGLAKKGKGTIILPFKDLREKNNDFQKANPKKSQKSKKANQEKAEYENKIGEIISELLVAELYKIRQIHEQAGQTDEQTKHIMQVSNPNICIDARSLCNQIIFLDSFQDIKYSSGELAENIGEVNEIGPVVGKISIAKLIVFLQQILPSLPFLKDRQQRVITGSIQGHDNNLRIIAHMEEGKKFFAWEIESKDINGFNNFEEQKTLSSLVKRLAYTIADKLSNHSIGCDSFIKFNKALESYSQYQRNQSTKTLHIAIEDCLDFYKVNPTHIRSFSLLYNLGIAKLAQKDNETAEKLFRNAIALEPYIVRRIFELQIPLKKLPWSNLRKNEFSKVNNLNGKLYKSIFTKFSNGIKNQEEQKILLKYSQGISYCLNALGQTLENQCQLGLCKNCPDKDRNCSNNREYPVPKNASKYEDYNQENKSKECDRKDKCHVYLSESIEAYQRASKLSTNNALSLSNVASLRIDNVKLLEETSYLRESILKKAKEDLTRAIKDKRIKKNKHLAYNRLGNLHHEQGNYSKAISCYKKALKIKRDFVVVYRNLGLIYLDKADFRSAIENFEKGIAILTDDELFHGNIYFKQLHAWFHNGIGWTCLMRAIFNHSKSENYSIQNCGDLIRAEHELQEAIDIFRLLHQSKSDIPLYVPYFNLGHVYAWRGNKKLAWEEWKKGLKICEESENENQVFFYMMQQVFNVVEKPSYTKKSEEELNKIEKRIKSDIFHWRFRNRILHDALALKESINYLKDNSKLDQTNATNILEDTAILINKLEDSLPSFNLGLAYLWKNDLTSVKNCWNQKIEKLKKESDEHKNDRILKFNNELWLYIYESLVCILDNLENSDKVCRSESKVRLISEYISPKKIMTIWSYSLILIHVYPIRNDLYTCMNKCTEKIRQCIKEIRKEISYQDNHSIKLIEEILDDINYKFKILQDAPKPFNKKCVESYYLNKLFDPIIAYREDLKKLHRRRAIIKFLSAIFKR